MEMRLQLPPSWRDFEAYRLVKVQQKSTRAAAKELGVSQTRVRQVIERVAAFLIETAPGSDDAERRERGLQVAEQVAAERVDFLYGQAVQCFKRSKGVHETIRVIEVEGKPTVTIGITREDYGDVRILMSAAKLALFGTKLPMPCLATGIEVEEEDGDEEPETEGKEVETETIEATPKAVSPPVSACSPLPSEQGAEAAVKREQLRVSLLQEISSMKEKLERVGSGKLLKDPVQLPNAGQGSPPREPGSAAS